MAAARAEIALNLLAEGFEHFVRHKRLYRSGKATAVDAAGTVAVKELFGQREGKRDVLMICV